MKRDFVWMGLVFIVACVGFVYAYGGSDPDIMGHSVGEIVDDVLCWAVTGHDCGEDIDTNAKTECIANKFLDGDGDCRTAAQIVADSGVVLGAVTSNNKLNCYTMETAGSVVGTDWKYCNDGYFMTGINLGNAWPYALNYVRCCQVVSG